MKILRVADVPDNRTGGMSRAMYGTGDVLQHLGHTVDYLFRERLDVRVPAQFRRFVVPTKIVGLIRALHKTKAYDVVEIHEPSAAVYCVARRYDRSLPPVVVFSHGLEERFHAATLGYERLQGRNPSIKQRLSPLTVVWQAAFSVKHADHVVCLSTEDYEHVRRRGVDGARVTRVHSGVEDAFLAAGESRAAARIESDPALLFFGTWIERKGVLDLVRAITAAFRRNSVARLTIAGCQVSSDTVLSAFPEDLRSRVTVIPKIDSSERAAEIYAAHSLFLLPSFFEGHPIAMIEAAALGLAIVTTATCGMRDFIEDGVNGRLVAVGDADALARIILEVLEDPARAQRLGRAAYATARRHTWAAAAAPLLQAYQRAAAEPIRPWRNARAYPGA